MARYRRKRYGRRRSTNIIRMKFQSFMDISTSDESMQIITISAGGKEILDRLAPQFSAYKYYKIGKISAKLVPASTLPVDPTGLSYEAGENTVDPRDQLTPGMMRITNGEDIFEDLTGLSDDEQHAIYNNMLLDPRWYKWMLQSGVKRFAYPKYWTIGQLHQDKWPGSFTNIPQISLDGTTLVGTATVQAYKPDSDPAGSGFASVSFSGKTQDSSPYGFFQTGHRGVLGWLPTDGLSDIAILGKTPLLASPPEIEVMKIILPKAYKTKYYYRVFITEEVLFREPIVNFGISAGGVSYRPLDIFHAPTTPRPVMPDDVTVPTGVYDVYTGGNYGND
nr:MAG: capsid protein [Canine associated porprismacovirus]